MMRLRLTDDDLASLRFAVSPAMQTVALLLKPGELERDTDRARGEAVLRAAGDAAEPLRDLLRSGGGYLPDFLSPAPLSDAPSIREELDLGARLPDWRVIRDAGPLEPLVPGSDVARELLAGEPAPRKALLAALRACFDVAFGDAWPAAQRILRADIDRRRRDLDRHGPEHVLATLHPALTWRRPVLTVRSGRCGQELTSAGNGVVLVPILGRSWSVATMINPWEPAVIGYPVGRPDRRRLAATVRPGPGEGIPAPEPIAKLLGRTRAQVLLALEATGGLTTTDLAREVGISLASASEHASVLRAAGLVRTERASNAVLHRPTWLGSNVASAAPAPLPDMN